MNFLIGTYNNYFNRILRGPEELDAIEAAMTAAATSPLPLTLENMNFNPGDGVDTKLILGKGTFEYNNWDQIAPDYLVVYGSDDAILSRWFILDMNRTRGGQYEISLRRDILADYYDSVIDAPCYIEKGFINDTNNPLICNTEGSALNEIKQKEQLIKDDTKCAWLVGYVKKGLASDTISGVMSKDLSNYRSAASLAFKDCIQYYDSNGAPVNSDPKKCVRKDPSLFTNALSFNYADFIFDPTRAVNWGVMSWVPVAQCYGSSYNGWDPYWDGIRCEALQCSYSNKLNDCIDYVAEKWEAFMRTPTGKNYYNNINSLVLSDIESKENVKLVKSTEWDNIATGTIISSDVSGAEKLYQLYITFGSYAGYERDLTFETNTPMNTACKNLFTSFANSYDNISLYTNNPGRPRMAVHVAGQLVTIEAREYVAPATLTINWPAYTSRNCLNDELYDMFCIPYNPEDSFYIYDGSNTFIVDNDVSVFMANTIMTHFQVQDAGANAYDLQLLPYCPFDLQTDVYNGKIRLRLDKLDTKSKTAIVDGSNNKKSYLIWPTSANFSKNIYINERLSTRYATTTQVQTGIDFIWNDDGICHIGDSTVTGLPDGWIYVGNPKIMFGDINITDDTDFYIDPSNNTVRYITWYWSNQGIEEDVDNVTITLTFDYKYELAPSPMEYKLANECDFYRLTSPNFNSMYQFKLTKFKDAAIDYINIDCTYKPFNPYIKLNPNFSGLYGQDFNDSTGLILSGDFSLSILSDPWKQYQLNNKNYEAMFGRQIQNLDVNQQIAREQQNFQGIVGAITGGVAGAGSGAYAGFKAGGGWGALAGGVAGAAIGVPAGILGYQYDKDWLDRSQIEAKNYSVDMYNYQLGNVQALPQSITKSSPFSYNFKVWPILEKFSCSEKERTMMENKIKYDGMTVNAIGSISEYSVSQEVNKVYVKGQLIRVEDIPEDFHVINELYKEVQKGFYVGK